MIIFRHFESVIITFKSDHSKKEETIVFAELNDTWKCPICGVFKDAFKDMKESAKEQHEVDKANFAAAKAEAKANFEENRGTNTFRKAKADAKRTWDEAHMSPKERQAKMSEERQKQKSEAEERIKAAQERYEDAKVDKEK